MRFLMCSSFGGLEAVAGAAYGFQVARVFGVRFDFFANAADVDVDGTRSDVRGVAPHGVEKMVAAEDASLVAGEVIEQAELGGGGGYGVAAHGQCHGGGIDFDVANSQGAGRQGPLEPAQYGFDAGDEFARAEGLGDVVVGAEFKT